MTNSTFEDRLLAELRTVVATRPAPEAVASPPARRAPRARLIVAAGAVGVVIAGVVVLTGGDPATPAYAVQNEADGSVTVEVRSLRDAAGLQDKLRAAGVPAVVDYAPAGKMCRQPRGRQAARGHTGGPARAGSSTAAQGPGGATFTIPRGDVRPGQTLVITSSVGSSVSSLSTEVVTGPVAPCKLVDAPPLHDGGLKERGQDSGPSFGTRGPERGGQEAGPSTHTRP